MHLSFISYFIYSDITCPNHHPGGKAALWHCLFTSTHFLLKQPFRCAWYHCLSECPNVNKASVVGQMVSHLTLEYFDSADFFSTHQCILLVMLDISSLSGVILCPTWCDSKYLKKLEQHVFSGIWFCSLVYLKIWFTSGFRASVQSGI